MLQIFFHAGLFLVVFFSFFLRRSCCWSYPWRTIPFQISVVSCRLIYSTNAHFEATLVDPTTSTVWIYCICSDVKRKMLWTYPRKPLLFFGYRLVFIDLLMRIALLPLDSSLIPLLYVNCCLRQRGGKFVPNAWINTLLSSFLWLRFCFLGWFFLAGAQFIFVDWFSMQAFSSRRL